LGEPQVWSGHFGDNIHQFPLLGFKPQTV